VELFKAQLDKFQRLNRQGFVSQNQLLDQERQLSEIQTKQSEDLANIGGINARLAEFRMRGSQRMVEYRREVETQLADVQKEAATLAERLTAVRDSYSRLAIRAPVAGIVVDVAVHTIGGVVKPGDRLMDIVPDDRQLVVEAQLPPQYIDRVRPGLLADVHFDSYVSLARRPVVTGEIAVVSADILTDPRTGTPYYAIRIRVPGSETDKLGNVKLLPGMQGTVVIKTGERTFMNYLMRPLLRRFTTAFTEA
jgi:protease secretion system membrane fusion protein